MSLRAKLAKLVEKRDALNVEIAKVEADVANQIDTDAIVAGNSVTFNYGKGDNKSVQSGVVLGRKAAEGKSPALIKVAVGSGFDSFTATISPLAVISFSAA